MGNPGSVLDPVVAETVETVETVQCSERLILTVKTLVWGTFCQKMIATFGG